jgi:glutamate synthase (NADPH/NADH) small chain
MGKVTGFLELDREVESYRDVGTRIQDFDEIFSGTHNLDQLQEQGSRCMDCGVPFCQSSNGCPIDNLIPEWNDLVYNNEWQEALERLEKTNNFPEFTGRVCPAPCEGSCVLGLNNPAVTIKNIELAIVDKGFEEGWIKVRDVESRSGKKSCDCWFWTSWACCCR